MSLFSKLFRFQSDERRRLEDFHTEIVANVLANDPDLTLDWLRELRVTEHKEADKVTVTTQERFDAIEELHDQHSRVDMVIRIRKGEYLEVVFIESKVGSSENSGQLAKYTEHLRDMRAKGRADRGTLVFITRDYEPKDDDTVPARWSEFYRFLNGREPHSDTIRELLKFMRENNMAQSNRFTALDLVALTNHGHACSLLEATLAEGIAIKFKIVTGSTWNKRDRIQQLQSKKFTMEGWPTGYDHQIRYELGYWFPDERPSDSPIIGMKISVDPKATALTAIAIALRRFIEASQGAIRRWDRSKEGDWETIECTKTLEEFLVAQDHVEAIKTWFDGLLEDAVSFRTQNPHLPWPALSNES